MMREWPYTASNRDILGCTSPSTSRFPSGLGKSLGRRGCTTQYIPPLGSVRIQYQKLDDFLQFCTGDNISPKSPHCTPPLEGWGQVKNSTLKWWKKPTSIVNIQIIHLGVIFWESQIASIPFWYFHFAALYLYLISSLGAIWADLILSLGKYLSLSLPQRFDLAARPLPQSC